MKKILKHIYFFVLKIICPSCFKTLKTAAPITFKTLFFQKILGFNKKAYWPMHFTSQVGNVKNIKIGIGTAPGFSPGCYIQGGGKTFIDDYTIIGPNVGIISVNHNIYDSRKHCQGSVNIGKYCWIGMNSTILPNVCLGDFTIVGAGSVVTKSFPKGYCVIAGNPAKIVKLIESEKCVYYKNEYEYYGYIERDKFDEFRRNNLHV